MYVCVCMCVHLTTGKIKWEYIHNMCVFLLWNCYGLFFYSMDSVFKVLQFGYIMLMWPCYANYSSPNEPWLYLCNGSYFSTSVNIKQIHLKSNCMAHSRYSVVKWLNNEWMNILPMRLFLPLAQEIALRIVGRCFKDEPLRATTLFHKLWTSTQMFIYRKGHTGFVCYVFVFNVKAIGPWSCSRIFTIGTAPFPNTPSLYFIGTSWSICHPRTAHLPGKTCAVPSSRECFSFSSLPVWNLLYFLGPAQSLLCFLGPAQSLLYFLGPARGQCFHIASMPRTQLRCIHIC